MASVVMLKHATRRAKSCRRLGHVRRSSCTICSSSLLSFSNVSRCRTDSAFTWTRNALPRAASSTSTDDHQPQEELHDFDGLPLPRQRYNSRHIRRSRGQDPKGTAYQAPKEEAQLDYLQRKTNRILSLRRPPLLGALDDASWNQAIALMEDWMIEPGRYQIQNDYQQQQRADGPPLIKVSGYALNAVELLLERLNAEQTTLGPHTLRRFERDAVLAQWQLALLHGWLQLSQHQQPRAEDDRVDVHLIAAMCERAERALGWIIEWYNRGAWATADGGHVRDDPLPAAAFTSLVQEWLRVNNGEGVVRAADLLTSWTEGDAAIALLENHKDSIGLCCNQAWEQCVTILQQPPSAMQSEVREQVRGIAMGLSSRMDVLRERGWDNLVQVTDHMEKIILLEYLSVPPSANPDGSSGDVSKKRRTSFEEQAIHQRMIDLVSHADENDMDMIVHKLIPSISLDSMIPEAAMGLNTALAEYFIRMKDAKRATEWVQRADRLSTLNQLPPPTTLLQEVFYLWLHPGEGSQSLWRADEILHRLEQLAKTVQRSSDPTILDSIMYDQLAIRWTGIAEGGGDKSMANRKIRQLFWRHFSDGQNSSIEMSALQRFLDAVADDVTDSGIASSIKLDEAEMLLAFLEKRLNQATDGNERKKVLGCFLQLLSVQPSLATKARDMTVEALSDDTLSDMQNFQHYDAALSNLFDKQNKAASFAAVNGLFKILLDRVAKEGLVGAEPASIGALLVNLIRGILVGSQDDHMQADVAEDLLLAAEKALLSTNQDDPIRKVFPKSPLTTECFVAMMKVFRAYKHYDKAERIFQRLEDYRDRGSYSDLTPDKDVYEGYIDLLGIKSVTTGSDPDEAKQVLDRLIALYRSTNYNEMYRPTQHSFFRVIRTYPRYGNGVSNPQVANRVLEVLSSMVALFSASRYEKVDPELFGMAIQVIQKSGVEDQYGKIVSLIYEQYILDPKMDMDDEALAGTRNRVLEAIGTAPPDQLEQALKTALALLIDIRKAGKQNAGTYIAFTSCIRDLCPNAKLRNQVAIIAFNACCEDGLLSRMLMNAFKKLISPDYWVDLKLVPGTDPSEKWSRHIEDQSSSQKLDKGGRAPGASADGEKLNGITSVDLEAGKAGRDTKTTLMVRNIPKKYKQLESNSSVDLEAVKAGLDTRTTLMVRNIPNKYTQQMLLSEFTENGLGPGVIDFFYLSMDFEREGNKGYAFINFVDSKDIHTFHQQYFGKKWRMFKSGKRCDITYARIQGKGAVVEWFRNSSLMKKDEEYKPMVFDKGQRIPFPMQGGR